MMRSSRLGNMFRLATLAGCLAPLAALGVEQKSWDVTPYRVRVELAVDVAARPEPKFAERLAESLEERIDAAIGPLWQADVVVVDGPRRWRLLHELPRLDQDETVVAGFEADKVLLATVQGGPVGWRIATREYDAYLQQWGDVRERLELQRHFVAEACFQGLVDAFSPLATVKTLPDDDKHVEIAPRGRRLPSRSGEALFLQVGQPLLPLIRRTDRAGELLKDGIVPLPWTYVSLTERKEDGSWLAEIQSGVRQPFRTRRRGKFEQIAVGLKPSGTATVVRFYARNDKSLGLAGYEVFRQLPGGGTELAGVTDRTGSVTLPRYPESVSTLFLRSDGQLLARIPVVSGATAKVEAPIADDAARLAAQAELRTVREDLIDLVARRAILMGRTRAYLDAGRLADAKKLVSELGGLATASEFDRRIRIAQRNNRSTDPQVQERIDAMFADTRSLLAKFLSQRQVTDLEAEVNSAAAQK